MAVQHSITRETSGERTVRLGVTLASVQHRAEDADEATAIGRPTADAWATDCGWMSYPPSSQREEHDRYTTQSCASYSVEAAKGSHPAGIAVDSVRGMRIL